MAKQYLQQHGLLFIAANVFSEGKEIDLIMRDRAVWVFVEVRYRTNSAFGDAAATVNQYKQQNIVTAARYWFINNNIAEDTVQCRFDVFAITGKQYHWIKNAF